MTISLKLLETEAEIEKNINEAISVKINELLIKSQSNIVNQVISLIPKWINDQPEIKAISSKELIGAFGFTASPSSIIDSIINAVCKSVYIKFKKFDRNLTSGGFELQIQPSDFNNLLVLPEGHTIYENGDLHWLNWLLLKGDTIIIVGYEYNPQTGMGRTGLGNMVSGQGFRVPPQYSGTQDNNFITRALIGPEQEQEITKIFKKILGV